MKKSKTKQRGTALATVDKKSRMPAYAQLADILRSAIAQGAYPPGARLPAESALAKTHGVSAMTARQAVSVLEEEGLVRRVQGRGTYVKKIGVATSSFSLDGLAAVFPESDDLTVRIVRATVKNSAGEEKKILGVEPHQPVIMVERVILRDGEPYTLHVSFARFDPRSPSVESMLDTVVLTDLMFLEGDSNFKRGSMHLMPTSIDAREAELLQLEEGGIVFKLEHRFYDFDDNPAAYGWFLVSHKKMPLISKIGIWDE